MPFFSKRRIFFLLTGCFLIVLSSCHVGPNYEPPQPVVPSDWKNSVETCASIPSVEYWWEVFDDACLNALEIQAINANPTLYSAFEKVLESRAVAGSSRSALFPELNLKPNYYNTGVLFKLYGIPTADFPGLKPIVRVHELNYYLPIDMSYEIDLWGKYRDQFASSLMNAEAELLAYSASMLTLTSELASNYFNLRITDTQISLYESTIQVLEEALDLNRLRYQKGMASYLDVTSAELQLSNVKAQRLDIYRQRTLFENAIAVLIGVPASDFSLPPNPLLQSPPCIPPGTPATILFQRPDVAEAERRMAANHALVEAGYASFFPSLSLTGALGYFSPTLQDFLTWQSRLWAIGANISQTIFDAGKKKSDLEGAWARFYQAEGSYQQVVLTAFREVEDALNNLSSQYSQEEQLRISVEAAQKTRTLSKDRYLKGLVSYFEALESQRAELDAQRNLANTLGLRYQATIQLIKAIGGTWENKCPLPIASDDENNALQEKESQEQSPPAATCCQTLP